MASDTKMLNLRRVLDRMIKLPQVMKTAAGEQLKVEVDGLVDAQKRAAPVDEASDHPGAFRDSIHAYKNPDRPLSWRVIADARDDEGKLIAANIEQGHRAVDGTHVAARPSFFPTYRARKKGIRRRILAKSKAALKQVYPR